MSIASIRRLMHLAKPLNKQKEKTKIMAIPEKQLQTWANQGAIQSSASTYASVKNCITNGSWKSDVYFDIYLQGSYKNTTNIYGNSDVDIIVEFTSVFHSDTSNLDEVGKAVHNALGPGKYTLAEFKTAIVKRLKVCYGDDAVTVGNSAIKIKGNGSRLDADVVVCNTHKKYKNNNGSKSLTAIKGIRFTEEKTGNVIINYPTPHYDNGVAKNQFSRTSSNLKKVTRIFKNMKASLVNHQAMSSTTAPSYFVECLVYNAMDVHFRKNRYSDIVVPIINQFIEDDKSDACNKYVCQNQQRWLFGSGDQQWNRDEAREYVAKLVYVWENYPL